MWYNDFRWTSSYGSGDSAKLGWKCKYLCKLTEEVLRAMATYVLLTRLNSEGAKTLKQDPNRIQAVNSEVGSLGAKVLSQYALLGPYDFITVLEAPDSDTVARVAVELSARGTMSIETFPAIPIDTFMASLKKS